MIDYHICDCVCSLNAAPQYIGEAKTATAIDYFRLSNRFRMILVISAILISVKLMGMTSEGHLFTVYVNC